jgi:hypothetical protein
VTERRVLIKAAAVDKQQLLHILSVSVALGIPHANRIRRLILSPVPCPAEQYFYTLSHKQHDFREQVLNKKCDFFVSLQIFFSEIFPILRIIERDINKTILSFRFSLCIFKVNHFYWPTNALNCIKLKG